MSERKRGIGGSDLAAVCAYYKPAQAEAWAHWATAADVWMRLVHGIERPRTSSMQRGLDAEPRLKRAFINHYGGTLEDHPRPWIITHPRLPFVSVSPDDVWVTPEGERVYVEWKTRNDFAEAKRPLFGAPGTDEIPGDYAMQVHLNLEILNIERGILFAGFGKEMPDGTGAKPFLYSRTEPFPVARDRELVEFALAYAERFHAEHVLTRTPPSVEPKNRLREWKRLMKEKPWKTEATEAPSQSSKTTLSPSPSASTIGEQPTLPDLSAQS